MNVLMMHLVLFTLIFRLYPFGIQLLMQVSFKINFEITGTIIYSHIFDRVFE